jgi:hypothetical protein
LKELVRLEKQRGFFSSVFSSCLSNNSIRKILLLFPLCTWERKSENKE